MRLLGVLAVLSLAFGSLAADKSEPEISEKKFPAPPVNLFYFDDSETVMVIEPEAKELWRSTDAGEEWKMVDDMGSGSVYNVYPHPFDNKVAVVLGIHKKHWITYDQGKSWKTFETKEHPTQRGQEPITFHATDSKKIMFHAQDDCLIFDMCVGNVRMFMPYIWNLLTLYTLDLLHVKWV
jgi:photosystem II stability/assembly factor-like uncharacterized protein